MYSITINAKSIQELRSELAKLATELGWTPKQDGRANEAKRRGAAERMAQRWANMTDAERDERIAKMRAGQEQARQRKMIAKLEEMLA